VCKVEALRAVLETDYFIKLIEKAEIIRDKQIQKLELGFATDGDEEPERPSK
jgi:hypothetical protein